MPLTAVCFVFSIYFYIFFYRKMNNTQEPVTQLITPKRTVKAITFQMKLDILKKLEAGEPRKKICEEFDIVQSTVSRVVLQRDAILELAQSDANMDRKRVVTVQHVELEDSLSKWALEMKKTHTPITRTMVMEKAEECARKLGIDFKPSSGWLYKWKARQNVILFKKSKDLVSGDSCSVNDSFNASLVPEEEGICTADINGSSEYIHKKKRWLLEGAEDNSTANLAFSKGLATEEGCAYIRQTLQNFEQTNLQQTEPLQNNNHCATNLTPNSIIDTQNSELSGLNSSALSAVSGFMEAWRAENIRTRKLKVFLTLQQKLEILQRLKNGEKRQDLMLEYSLSPSAMFQIIQDEKKLLKLAADGRNLKMKRMRGAIFKDIENELNLWVHNNLELGEILTRQIITKKAKEIAERLNLDFKASNGWLEKWKNRMNYTFNDKQMLQKPAELTQTSEDQMEEMDDYEESPVYPDVMYEEEMLAQREPDIRIKEEIDPAYHGSQSPPPPPLPSCENHGNLTNPAEPQDIKPVLMGTEAFSSIQDIPQDIPIESINVDSPANIKNEPDLLNETMNELPQTHHNDIVVADDVDGEDEDDDDDDGGDIRESLPFKLLMWMNEYRISKKAANDLLKILKPYHDDLPTNLGSPDKKCSKT